MYFPTLVPAGMALRARLAILSVLLLTAGSVAGESEAAAGSPAIWLGKFQQYTAQENIQNDRSYSPEAAPVLRWTGLMQDLPPPDQWQPLQAQLVSAIGAQPEGVERSRLQAGAWLLEYLLNGKGAVLSGLPPPPGDPAQATPATYALENLRQALTEDEQREISLEQQVKQFEEQLAMFEPVDIEAVKSAIGGEENFARLHRLIDAGKAMQGRMGQVYEEYEKTKDEAAARSKMDELQKEYEAAHAADHTALEPFQAEPLIGRYVNSLYQQEMSGRYTPTLPIPDLVTAVGAEQAEALLRRALRLPVKLSLSKESGDPTAKLARALALAEKAELKVPSWGLAHDVAADRLFVVLQARFGEPAEDDYEYRQARGYFLAALIQGGRVPEAVVLASRSGEKGALDLPYEVLNALERGGHAEALWHFLREWLTRHPGGGEWDRFNRLSAQLDRKTELKTLIQSLAEQGAFVGMDRLRVQRMQADAELAADELTAAEKRLRALVAPPAETTEELRGQMDVAEKLIQLADLQGNVEAADNAFAAAEAVLLKCRSVSPETAIDLAATLATAFNQLGRFDDAVRVSREALVQADALKEAAGDRDGGGVSFYSAPRLVGEQLRSLTSLGQWAEAEKLMRESRWWAAGELSELLNETVYSDRKPLGWHFAQVAAERGNSEQARKILEAQLVATPGVDAVYESYLARVGKEARPLLAKLAAVDRYEERPLIWQARLHLDAQELDQAVAALEAAIALDPSDGEQGRGDRMRVYAFLARAMAARGDAAKATFLDGVVKAIRLSETADRWFDAGAYARAIRLYRESLGYFQDAYCIQSRLAVRLAGEGKMDEAAEHYRRAFELMPDSFGRVESHCFGCEHVFAGEPSQGVAEEVFTRMLAARPDKPQLHYLFGYLRQEQKRTAESAEHYRKAVALDPLYLNAWKKLSDLESELKFTPEQRDDLLLKLVELDPARRHVSPDLARVADLPRLWRALDNARSALAGLPVADKLWTLDAAAAEMEGGRTRYSSYARRTEGTGFGTVLSEHRVVQALQQYLAALNAPNEQE